MLEKSNAQSVLVGKPEGNRTFGRPRHRWEDITNLVHKEIGW
jgi:hypothetical protein